MRNLFIASAFLFITSIGFGADLKSSVRDAALQIAGNVGSSSLSDSDLSNILSQLQGVNAQLSGSPGSKDLYCEAFNGVYSYLARVSDGHRLTNYIDTALCKDAVANVRNSLVCIPMNSVYSTLYNYKTDKKLIDSAYGGADDCTNAVKHSTATFVCAPLNSVYATLTVIADGSKRGGLVSTSDCFNQIGG